MKRILLTFFLTVMATAMLQAQQISVVSSGGTTKLYSTLADAINGADPGSVIYLPGGGFSISDDVKILKKLTIIGIGHKSNNDNVDGCTIINGNLFFNEGSSGSAIIGCYLTGNVNIGEDGLVKNMMVKFCSLNSVQVLNSDCSGTVINQNYVRGGSNFGNTEVTITNNIISKISNVASGAIKYNVVCFNNYYNYGYGPGNPDYSLDNVNNTIIAYNIFRYGTGRGMILSGSNCSTSNNFLESGSFGDDPIVIDASINDILINVNDWSISPKSNFHFNDNYKLYENKVGIYAGDRFNDNQLAPVPYIVAKQVDQQTDASGKLNIKIRVKAGQ